MNEFYFSRQKAFFALAGILLCNLALIIFGCFIPSITFDSAATEYALLGVLIFCVPLMICVFFIYFRLSLVVFRRQPAIVVTDDKLQVYDTNQRNYVYFSWSDVTQIEWVTIKHDVFFDVFVSNSERYQQPEAGFWSRFFNKLNDISLKGAVVRIPASSLDGSPYTIFNILQSFIRK